jgi:hypothetical protein
MLQLHNVSELNVNVTEHECTKRISSTIWHVCLCYISECISAHNDNVTGSICYRTSKLQNIKYCKKPMLQNVYCYTHGVHWNINHRLPIDRTFLRSRLCQEPVHGHRRRSGLLSSLRSYRALCGLIVLLRKNGPLDTQENHGLLKLRHRTFP